MDTKDSQEIKRLPCRIPADFFRPGTTSLGGEGQLKFMEKHNALGMQRIRQHKTVGEEKQVEEILVVSIFGKSVEDILAKDPELEQVVKEGWIVIHPMRSMPGSWQNL